MWVLLGRNQLILISRLSYDLGFEYALHFVIVLSLSERTYSIGSNGRCLSITFDVWLLSFRFLPSNSSSSCIFRHIFNFSFLWTAFSFLGTIHFLTNVLLAALCFSLLLSLLYFWSSFHQFKYWADGLISVLSSCSVLTCEWANFNFFHSVGLFNIRSCSFSFSGSRLLNILSKRGGFQTRRCLFNFWKLLFNYFFFSLYAVRILKLIWSAYHKPLKLTCIIWWGCKNSIIFNGFFWRFFLFIFK